MLITTEGIVLRQRKIAGNRRMIVIFTRQYGKISAGTSINEKGRNKSALALRPFTFAEYEIFRGRESYSINSASVKKSYYSIGEDLDKFMAASSFIDYLDKVLQDEESMPALFELALNFLEALAGDVSDPKTLLYAFIVKTFPMLGVMPELSYCVDCGRPRPEKGQETGHGGFRSFSVISGGIVCDDCAEKEKTEGNSLIYSPPFDIIDTLRFFISKPLETFKKVSLRREVSSIVERILAEYADHYLGADIVSGNKGMEE